MCELWEVGEGLLDERDSGPSCKSLPEMAKGRSLTKMTVAATIAMAQHRFIVTCSISVACDEVLARFPGEAPRVFPGQSMVNLCHSTCRQRRWAAVEVSFPVAHGDT